MPVRVGINGFGRIGRNIMRAAMADKNIDFVAVNDLTTPGTLAHLLKYDSVLGNIHATVEAKGDAITVDGDEFKVLSKRDRPNCRGKNSALTSSSSRRACSRIATGPPSTSRPAPRRSSSPRPPRDRT